MVNLIIWVARASVPIWHETSFTLYAFKVLILAYFALRIASFALIVPVESLSSWARESGSDAPVTLLL